MSYPPVGYARYPESQQYYRINLAALSWGELRRAGGGGCLLLTGAPLVAFCKLFHLSLAGGERFPREVSFQQPDRASYDQSYQAVAYLLEPLQALGFEHFTTFTVPEMPYRSMVFALMNRAEDAYAAAYHVISPMGHKTAVDLVTVFRDGSGLKTTNAKEGVAMEAPAHHRRLLVAGGAPAELWDAHRAEVARLAPAAGGVSGPVGHEHFIHSWRRSIRESADFYATRGVYVPAA